MYGFFNIFGDNIPTHDRVNLLDDAFILISKTKHRNFGPKRLL